MARVSGMTPDCSLQETSAARASTRYGSGSGGAPVLPSRPWRACRCRALRTSSWTLRVPGSGSVSLPVRIRRAPQGSCATFSSATRPEEYAWRPPSRRLPVAGEHSPAVRRSTRRGGARSRLRPRGRRDRLWGHDPVRRSLQRGAGRGAGPAPRARGPDLQRARGEREPPHGGLPSRSAGLRSPASGAGVAQALKRSSSRSKNASRPSRTRSSVSEICSERSSVRSPRASM